MNHKHILVPIFWVVALAGCTTSLTKPLDQDVVASEAEASKLLSSARHGAGAMSAGRLDSVKYVDDLWLPASKSDNAYSKPNSALLKKRITVNREFRNMQEIAERITYLTGIPVNVSQDVGNVGTGTGGGSSNAGSTSLPSSSPMMLAPPAQMFSGRATSLTGQVMNLPYDGPLDGFLDIAAARFGVAWEESEGKINIFRFKTQTFSLVALPGNSTMKSSVTTQTGSTVSGGGSSVPGGAGGTGATQSGGGGSSSTSDVSFNELSVWKAIEDAIKNMQSPGAPQPVVTPATGTVTVTDVPVVVERIGKFIRAQNESLAKQVVVNVRVLSVELTNQDQYGINWTALYGSMTGKYGLNLSNMYNVAQGASNLAIKVLGTSGTPWAGSQAIIAALSEQGKVSQKTSASLTTLNNQPAPLQVGRQTSFLASSQTTLATSVGSSTALTPGTVSTGFSMSVVPHVLDRGRLMLQFSVNISSLLAMNSISSGGSTIQAPDVDTRNFLQRVMLNSGETMVLTGFEQNGISTDAQGVGSPHNALFGGGVNGNSSRSLLVILIQPIVGDA
jgi:type IVB pilus formation R64 PilN family outer membrane protein